MSTSSGKVQPGATSSTSTSGGCSNRNGRCKKPLMRRLAPAPRSEAALRLAIVKEITRRYPLAWVYHPSDRFRTAIPDLLICLNGKFLAIEVKLPWTFPTKLQDIVLQNIRHAGGRAWVIRRMEELRDAVLA